MSRLIKLIPIVLVVLLSACQSKPQEQEQQQQEQPQEPPKRVATSFWEIVNPYYADHEGYTIIHAEGKTRHCIPITGWYGGYDDDYHHLHHHGVAVESELMAYRIYFDEKQTIDVYCKRTPRLELAQSYWYPNDSLLAEHYGDDILRVGGTVGVGTVKYWNGKLCHIENVGERQQWIQYQSADTAIISVGDIDWEVPDGKQNSPSTRTMACLHADYTMCAGHRDMRCEVRVTTPLKGLCTGVQCIPAKNPAPDSDKAVIVLPNGILLASWGTDWPVNDTVKYAKETVGLGVFIPKAFAGKPVHDNSNNLCLLKVQSHEDEETSVIDYQAHFYLTCVGATKEDHPVATNATEWYDYLRQWAEGLQ